MCKYAQVPGISYDGGYSDYMIAPTVALAEIPKELSYTEAAPLMCAGITTYNALRNSGARVGDVVAIIGIGGLGHLGISLHPKWVLGPLLLGEVMTRRKWLENLVHYITLIANLKMQQKKL